MKLNHRCMGCLYVVVFVGNRSFDSVDLSDTSLCEAVRAVILALAPLDYLCLMVMCHYIRTLTMPNTRRAEECAGQQHPES